MIFEVLIIGILALLLIFVVGFSLLRLMSRKCPNCDHYSMTREGNGFRCSNGHCDCLFTDQEESKKEN